MSSSPLPPSEPELDQVIHDSGDSKPWAVLILQTVVVVVLLGLLIGIVRNGIRIADGMTVYHWGLSPSAQLAVQVIATLWFAAVFIATLRRLKAARALGVLTITIFGLPAPINLALDTDASPAHLIGYNGALLAISLTFVYWAYAFGLSRKARRYFALKGALNGSDSA